MQIKHVDKRLHDREKYAHTIKHRTLAVMISAIVIMALYAICFICALAAYGYIAPNIAIPQEFFIENFVANDATAKGILTCWSAFWFIYMIIGTAASVFMIVNLALLLRASTKMARRYDVVKIRGWFIMLLVFAAAVLAYIIIDFGFSIQSYAAGSTYGTLKWVVAGPCKTIQEWLTVEGSGALNFVALIPVATMVLAIVQRKVGKKYIKQLYSEDR